MVSEASCIARKYSEVSAVTFSLRSFQVWLIFLEYLVLLNYSCFLSYTSISFIITVSFVPLFVELLIR